MTKTHNICAVVEDDDDDGDGDDSDDDDDDGDDNDDDDDDDNRPRRLKRVRQAEPRCHSTFESLFEMKANIYDWLFFTFRRDFYEWLKPFNYSRE